VSVDPGNYVSDDNLRSCFWLEVALGTLTTALLVLTLAWPQWIELMFGIEPDGGDGSLEWL
jgi:hypothetical protein